MNVSTFIGLGTNAWLITSMVNIIFLYWIYRMTRKVYHVWYLLMWTCCAIWAATASLDTVPIVQIIDLGVLPLIAGISGFIGILLKYNELIRERNKNKIKI